MEHDQTRPQRPCGDNCGTLPSCAPLAVPFVPFQQECSNRYQQEEALANGTLFPGLDLPFHLKPTGAPLPNSAAAELQALDFVLTELGLYLDTHKNDKEAMALYRQYAKLAEEGRARYIAMYGPLVQMDVVKDNAFTWLDDPWPWEFSKDGGKR